MQFEFKTESKRLMELMIHSIYTNQEIFLRELISNASDAIDKAYIEGLRGHLASKETGDFEIKIIPDKDQRILIVEDNGIGMDREELEYNLGTIANSGSLNFRETLTDEEEAEVIGQFGVGFYASFMVAKKVVVESKSRKNNESNRWVSEGVEGFSIEPMDSDSFGTRIVIYLKDNEEDQDYDEYLNTVHLKYLVEKYSNYIRFPIKLIDGQEEKIVNSMVPIWRKQKSELNDDDYLNFYRDRHFGFDEPIKTIHQNVEGLISFRSLLYIPGKAPIDYYAKEFERGLTLYSNGVMIMEKCPELLADYFGFVQGVVDSDDLSLNISREMLQQNRQLQFIANKLNAKIKDELMTLLQENPDDYQKFFKEFGRQLKYGIYSSYGLAKEDIQDLLIFDWSGSETPITLNEYVDKLKESQDAIYYATGGSYAQVSRLPQVKRMIDRDYPVIFLYDDIDEFVIKMMLNFKGHEFKSVQSDQEAWLSEDEKQQQDDLKKENQDLIERIKTVLGDEIIDVTLSQSLGEEPACLSAKGEVSIEMEKVLQHAPIDQQIKAEKILELNVNHGAFEKLEKAQTDDELFNSIVRVLYQQARLMEGLAIDDPIQFTKDTWTIA